MSRPLKCRRIQGGPAFNYFKPRGIPISYTEEIILTVDEFEAVRLADLEGLYQQQAAEKMEVSRQTFGNILNSAHKKIADCLVNGKAIKIGGGVCFMAGKRTFRCCACEHEWGLDYGIVRPVHCPRCESNNIHRAQKKDEFVKGFHNLEKRKYKWRSS